MNKIQLNNYGLKELRFDEILECSGGHDGTAYKYGHAFMKGLRLGVEILGVVLLFLTPKS